MPTYIMSNASKYRIPQLTARLPSSNALPGLEVILAIFDVDEETAGKHTQAKWDS